MAHSINLDPTQQAVILKTLLHEIETLRDKRRDDWKGKQHPQLKRFTQQEIVMGPCPTYQNLLIGRSLRLPDRQTIMNIADYLECNLTERNQLLLSAQYLPEKLQFEGIQLEQARQEVIMIINHMTFPAYAVDKWHIYAVNDLMLQVMNMQHQHDYVIQHAKGPGVYFDPKLFRPYIDITPELFTENVHDCLQLQRYTHTMFQYETWYQDLIKEAQRFPDFMPIWDNLGDTPPIHITQTKRPYGSEQLLKIRSISMRPFTMLYPSIVGLVPADDVTKQYFLEIGIHTSDAMIASYTDGIVTG